MKVASEREREAAARAQNEAKKRKALEAELAALPNTQKGERTRERER